MGVMGSSNRSLSRIAGLLLLVRLATAAPDLASRLRLLRALSSVCLFGVDGTVERAGGCGCFGQLLAEFNLAGRFPRPISNFYGCCHRAYLAALLITTSAP